jgi:hypothetical protein
MAMQEPPHENVREVMPRGMILIVVGAHLDAERDDRPLAYRLRNEILSHLEADGEEAPRTPVVCTDLWYLNDETLRGEPTIAVGRPEVNACTAYLAGRIPTALVVEDRYRIQLDPELVETRACLWGMTGRDTAAAVEMFVGRYLEGWLGVVVGR